MMALQLVAVLAAAWKALLQLQVQQATSKVATRGGKQRLLSADHAMSSQYMRLT